MLNDRVRNDGFINSLRSKLSRPKSVLDLGSGTGQRTKLGLLT